MKRAVLYQNDKRTLIHSFGKTTSGLWIWTNPVFVFTGTEINSMIAQKFLEALTNSKQEVEHPQNWTGFYNPVLEKLGVKSVKSFHTKMKSIEAEQEGEELKLIPMKNLGYKNGFEPIVDKIIFIRQDESIENELINQIESLLKLVKDTP